MKVTIHPFQLARATTPNLERLAKALGVHPGPKNRMEASWRALLWEEIMRAERNLVREARRSK